MTSTVIFHTFIQHFYKLYFCLATRVMKKRFVCLFIHLFASANTNTSANGQDWLSLVWKPTAKPGAAGKNATFSIFQHKLLLYFVSFLDSILETTVGSLRLIQLCPSLLLAAAANHVFQQHEHSKPHTSTSPTVGSAVLITWERYPPSTILSGADAVPVWIRDQNTCEAQWYAELKIPALLYSTLYHELPPVQSEYLVGTNCCIIRHNTALFGFRVILIVLNAEREENKSNFHVSALRCTKTERL